MSANTPAGWYPDPRSPAQIRYWTGSSWSEYVAPRVTAAQQASPRQVVQQVAQQLAQRRDQLQQQLSPAQRVAADRAAAQQQAAQQQAAQHRAQQQQYATIPDAVAPQPHPAPAVGDEEALARTLLLTGGVAAGIGFLGALKNELESRTAERNARLAAAAEDGEFDDEWDGEAWDDEDSAPNA